MKIGFDAKRFFLNKTGLGNYSRDIIYSFLEKYKNDEYHLFTTKTNDELVIPSEVKIHTPPSNFFITKYWWRSLQTASLSEKYGLDIYHGLSNEIPLVEKNKRTKYVVSIHDLIFLKYPHQYPKMDRNIYLRKVKYACKNADKIVAISEQTKRDLINDLSVDERKIEVVYQSCHEQFKRQVAQNALEKVKEKYNLPSQYLLTVGTVERRKNQEVIIQALAKSKLEIPLVIVGKPTPYQKKLTFLVKELKLEQQIHFLDYVDFQDLPAIYQNANLFVYPSLYEGFGIPILEALYAKIPVITSKNSCLEEVGGKNSYYVNPTDSGELADAIAQILNLKTEDKTQVLQSSYEHSLTFTNRRQVDELYAIYSNLLS